MAFFMLGLNKLASCKCYFKGYTKHKLSFFFFCLVGLLAKKAVEAGLVVKPYIRTSLSPGSGMVTHYLSSSGVLPYLSKLGYVLIPVPFVISEK